MCPQRMALVVVLIPTTHEPKTSFHRTAIHMSLIFHDHPPVMKYCIQIPHTARRGFTLFELMVVVAILAILAALAAPGFSEMAARYQTEATAEQLNSLISKAQTESLRRSGFVQLQKYEGIPGSNPCAAPQDWSCGVRLMADVGKKGTYDTVLSEISIPAGVTLTNVSTLGSGDADKLPFDRWGRAVNTNKPAFVQAKAGFDSANRAVCVDTTNRIRTIRPANLATPCS